MVAARVGIGHANTGCTANGPSECKTRRRSLGSFLAALFGILASTVIAAQPCPDARAIELFERAVTTMADRDELAAVIRAATRPIDEPARIRACRRLALALDVHVQRVARERHDLRSWPTSPTTEDVLDQRAALDTCPHYARPHEPPLPIMRATVQPPDELIREGVTGWVEVEATVDARGSVSATEVIASSDSRLEPWARSSVELSIYRPPSSHGSSEGTMRARQIIITDAFDIARARGCAIDVEEFPVVGGQRESP